jgi:surface polysaccharide O-acyltransferase-like enzyme
MIFIMVGHSLYFPFPNSEQINNSPVFPFLFFQAKSFTVVGVNVFVLISGWFGIKFNLKKLASLLFQTIFFAVLIYTALLILFPKDYSNLESFSTIFFFRSNDYWFVKAYIGLFLLAPMMNKFVETSTKKQITLFLILFYTFQFIYGWLNLFGAHWFEGGFSLASFIGLYILARYIRIHVTLDHSLFYYTIILGSIGIGMGLLAFILAIFDVSIYGRLFTYTNPLVITMSVIVVILFSKIKLQSNTINVLASSCFGIYLLHANELLLHDFYFSEIKTISETNAFGIAIILITLWLLSWAIAAILIDFIRKRLWFLIDKHFFKEY